ATTSDKARVPSARLPMKTRRSSLDNLIRPLQKRLWNGQAEGLGGLEVDHQVKLCGLLDRQVSRAGTLEYLATVGGRAAGRAGNARSIGDEAPQRDNLPGNGY